MLKYFQNYFWKPLPTPSWADGWASMPCKPYWKSFILCIKRVVVYELYTWLTSYFQLVSQLTSFCIYSYFVICMLHNFHNINSYWYCLFHTYICFWKSSTNKSYIFILDSQDIYTFKKKQQSMFMLSFIQIFIFNWFLNWYFI